MKGRCWYSITVNFPVDRFSTVFENKLQRWSTVFFILTTLFAAFRNYRSVRSNFTAQAHLCFPLSDGPVNRETSQGKPGKYHTWVGRQKCDGQKSPKSPGVRMSYQNRAADDSKPTDAHTGHIHKNRCISLYKTCTSRLHSDELRRVSIRISAAAGQSLDNRG